MVVNGYEKTDANACGVLTGSRKRVVISKSVLGKIYQQYGLIQTINVETVGSWQKNEGVPTARRCQNCTRVVRTAIDMCETGGIRGGAGRRGYVCFLTRVLYMHF